MSSQDEPCNPPAQSRIVYDVIDTHISVLRFFPGAESKRPKPQPHIKNLNFRDEFVWNEQPCPPTGSECIKATSKPGWPNEVHWLANNIKLDQQPELKWVNFVPSLPQGRVRNRLKVSSPRETSPQTE